MQDEDFVWLDVRWTKPGWLEVFRLRLTGWLPAEETATGLAHGVIKRCAEARCRCVELTERGSALTEGTEIGSTEANFGILAEVLRWKGFGPDWLSGGTEETVSVLNERKIFDESFRAGILTALDVDEKGQRLH